jgi:hypothetical protein
MSFNWQPYDQSRRVGLVAARRTSPTLITRRRCEILMKKPARTSHDRMSSIEELSPEVCGFHRRKSQRRAYLPILGFADLNCNDFVTFRNLLTLYLKNLTVQL